MERKHPTRPAPRWFDARELAMVAVPSRFSTDEFY
jgi:hypothetical protein